MNMQCLRCGSTEFTKLSLVYEQGSSTLRARSRGLGLAIGTGGASLVLGRARTTGEIETKLSIRVSPPHKWSCWKTVVGGLIGLMALEFTLGYAHTFGGFGGNFNRQLSWLAWAYLGVLVLVLGVVLWYNSRVFPKRYQIWDRSFMCRRCGHVVQMVPPIPSQPKFAREVWR